MQWNTDYLLRTLLIPSAYQGIGFFLVVSLRGKNKSSILFLKCIDCYFWSKINFWHADRYLLHYILDYTESNDLFIRLATFILAFLVVGLIGFGKFLFVA